MAVDKLVDSAELDAALSYTADRIRLKTGGAEDLNFDLENGTGFGDAVDDIETGGGGGSTLGTKTITANDTYDASDDDLDGYSQVTVSVPASAVDTGTKSISTNGTHDVTGYASASVSVPTGTARSSSDLTASGATVTAPAGLYAEAATKSVASGSATTPATTITANPSISVNSSTGVITASASATQSVTPTVSAGYVSSGTAGTITVSGSNTSSLTTQAAQTIHPSTSDQTIASGKYLTGAQTVKAVTHNLTAGDIKKDVVVKIGDSTDDDCVASITGTYEGGGGGYTANDWFDMAKPTGAVSFSGSSFHNAALREHTGITSVSIPNVTTIASSFYGCTGLTSVYAPLLETVTGTDAFRSTKIEYAVFPSLKRINSNGFLLDTSLKAADFGGEAEGIGLGNAVFSGCTQMNLLILRGSVLWPLNNVGTFNNSPFASGKAGGTIYIPKSLYDHLGDGGSYDYQAATNWSTVYGYGTITWAKIEGSYYETHYADGTAIPSS